MPFFFRASVFQPVSRTRNSSIIRGVATVAGVTANHNTVVLTPETLRTSAVLRNIHNIFVPASTEVLWFGYTDDADLRLTGFPLEAGASIAVEAGLTVFVRPGAATNLPYAIDDGTE